MTPTDELLKEVVEALREWQTMHANPTVPNNVRRAWAPELAALVDKTDALLAKVDAQSDEEM